MRIGEIRKWLKGEPDGTPVLIRDERWSALHLIDVSRIKVVINNAYPSSYQDYTEGRVLGIGETVIDAILVE